MIQYFRDMTENPLLASGLAAGLLASVSCGVIGPYVVTRRIVFLSGAIAHMAVGGIGAALFLSWQFPGLFAWFQPIHGAILSALVAAVIIGIVNERVTERMDTLIGALWAVGMAIGLVLTKLTHRYDDLMSYLFGNIACVDWDAVRLMAVLNVIILVAVFVWHKRLLAICLDSQQAELQGINVLRTNLVLLCLVALTVICLTQVVGLILVIALLSLPAATAAHHVTRMGPMIVVSIGLGALVTTVPRIAVYGARISPESAIVLATAGVYLISVVIRQIRLRRA